MSVKTFVHDYTLTRIDVDDVCGDRIAHNREPCANAPPPLWVQYKHGAQTRRTVWINPDEDLHLFDHVLVSSHAKYAPFVE